MSMMLRRTLRGLLSVSIIVFTASLAGAVSVGDYQADDPANGVGSSRHNLGSFGRVITTTATTEICVFCHTPHHARTASNVGPLWNKGNASSYTAYGKTMGGTTVNNADIGSTTLACLSCHDGVTTFDNIVNAPGKGGISTNGTNLNWTFSMPLEAWGFPSTAADHFYTGSPATCTGCHTNSGSQITRLRVGTSLTDDHPVSIAYNSGVASLRDSTTVIADIDLTGDLASSAASAWSANLLQNRWAVKGYISVSATIGDLLRNNRVECSSCHDPHFRNLSWDEVESTWGTAMSGASGDGATWCGNVGENCTDGNFLRRVGGNTGSGVCRTCHNK